jgi:hypothetical protein
MSTTPSLRWRIPLLLAGVMILAGPQHPRGSTMLQMLGHADWLANHLLMTASLIAFGVGLVLLRRGGPKPERTARWLRFAIIATALQTVEAVVHTAAVVDHGNLAAGRATPVLSTHLAMAVVVYPLFGAAVVGLIVAAARERVLGSWWIAWIGIIGATAHGAAAPLRILTGYEPFSILFAGIVPLALWMALAGGWPLRAGAPARRAAPLPAAGGH